MTMLADTFRAALVRILERCGAPPAVLVAALSGGVDSVVALHLLARCRDVLPAGCAVVAAHVHHGLRIEAGEDAAFCRAYAARLGVEYAERVEDVGSVAAAERIGLEEAGRRVRYGFFRELAGEGGLVVTGHHADDQAETVLLHLRRGAHRRGLAGMRELGGETVPVARPLLGVSRGAILEYARAHGLEWRVDASNAENVFARNRIRNRILPALERLMPGFRDRLLARAEAFAREEEGLVSAAAGLVEKVARREAGGVFFRVGAGAAAEAGREVFVYALRQVIEEEGGGRVSSGAVLERVAALAEGGRLGETVALSARLCVRREVDGVFFFRPEFSKGEEAWAGEILLPAPPFCVEVCGVRVSASWEDAARVPAADAADAGVEYLRAGAVRLPLRLRAPRAGERFRALGAAGGRKVQDMLVDAKIPRRLRGFPRVVADEEGAVWIWPLRVAERVRLPEGGGRALRVCVRELTS